MNPTERIGLNVNFVSFDPQATTSDRFSRQFTRTHQAC